MCDKRHCLLRADGHSRTKRGSNSLRIPLFVSFKIPLFINLTETSSRSSPPVYVLPTTHSAVDNTSHPDTMPTDHIALKLLIQAKITSSNCVDDVETLDGLTDDWPEEKDSNLTDTALDIHLHCEAVAKECHAIIATLDAFATSPNGSPYAEQFIEMVRPP